MFFISRPALQRMIHPVPILLYHSVGVSGAEHSTPVRVFQHHMRHLKEAGHTAIGLERFGAILEGRAASAPRQVLITFDGGCRSVYRTAWPILRQYGLRGALFVTVGKVRAGGGQDRDPACLSWEELRDLKVYGGFDIQCRSYSEGSFHPGIRFGGRCRRDKVRADLETARRVLSENLELAPESLKHLAWPKGYCDEELELVANSLGFTHQYLIQRGAATRHGATGRLPRLCCDKLPPDSFAHQLRWLSHRNSAHVVNLAGAMHRWSRSQPAYS
jgi:peptidoglycan/xylan/chitin deacetylase (PgdA/CDA1 family)